MKRSLVIGLTSLVILNGIFLQGASLQAQRTCEVGEASVCFDENKRAYAIEPNAQVNVEVLNSEYGEALIQLWNETHPESAGALTYSLINSGLETDVRFVSLAQAAFLHETSTPLLEGGEFSVPAQIAPELNAQGLNFIPMSAQGFAFLTNLDRLSEKNIALDDVDSDYRLDAVDTLSEIQTLFASSAATSSTLALSLNEPYIFYPFLTSSGWQLFSENEAKSPGFEKPEFLQALKNLDQLSTFDWNGSADNTASTYTWNYASALESGDFSFNIVSSWMFVEELRSQKDAHWQISAFPSFDETSTFLSPFLTQVMGYQLNSSALYPSAAHEVLRLIRSPKGLEAFSNHTQEIPVANQDALSQIVFQSESQKQFAYALSAGRSEPLIAFEDQPTLAAFTLFYEINLMPTLQALWDDQMTPEEAQIQIAMASDAWLFTHLNGESELSIHEPQ